MTAALKAVTSAWMGMSSFKGGLAADHITLSGDRDLSRSFTRWIGCSGLAGQARLS